ncbi:MAG: HNH endonuclease [Candidatus Woesearchaeota archaeon]
MDENKRFRTYKRRAVTRSSGYEASGEKTGGECIVKPSFATISKTEEERFIFKRKEIELHELFERNIGILAFGGYFFTENDVDIKFALSYEFGEKKHEYEKKSTKKVEVNDWNPVGFHKEFSLDIGRKLKNVMITMTFKTDPGNILRFIGFDFDRIDFNYYKQNEAYEYFNQKTTYHIPHIYYLNTLLPFSKYLVSQNDLYKDIYVVMKSCNRCTRYLPINIHNEVHSLGFSLHCKKRAPCEHSLFSDYKIDNKEELNQDLLRDKNYIDNGRVKSYYGHQLECKACKKFFVNAPLNPMRTSQQFREDSLRRRHFEILINILLDKKIIHHEFKRKHNQEFSEHIWKKFNKRCFKCGEKLKLDEMHLDHTMPLAYLYRLDETATCLCSEHNIKKRDTFPVDFYSEDELIKLSKITGLNLETLYSRKPNEKVVQLLIDNITWFFDEFLDTEELQKVRDDKLTADKVYAAINRVIGAVDLVHEYYAVNNKYPSSVTLKKEN